MDANYRGVSQIKKIGILIADDYPITREGLATIINRQPDMRVVAEAGDGQAAVEQFFMHHPDIALLDIKMPILDGVSATLNIHKRASTSRIILLSEGDDNHRVYQGLKEGAQGYFLKSHSPENLLEAIREVHNGANYISASAAGRLLSALMDGPELSYREVEVLGLMAAGKSNKEIASILFITTGTVKNHVSNVLKKLNAAGRMDAISLALRYGFISPIGMPDNLRAPLMQRSDLTSREMQVLQLMAENRSNKEIASILAISMATVKFHVSNLLDKLNATGRVSAINLAVRQGLVNLG